MPPISRCAFLAPALVAAIACAQGDVLDQSYLPSPLTNGLEVTATQPVTQTFTVGLTGILTRIEIARINHHRGTPTAPLQVDLVTTDPFGVPTSTSLATVTVQPASVPTSTGPLQVDLTAFAIPVQTGLVLGIALSSQASPGGATYAWWGEAPGGSYANGQVFIQQTVSLSVWDLAFQTWVSAPASWTNYGAGHPGTNGVPGIGLTANPVLGTTPAIVLGNSLGAGTLGALLFGFGRASVPTPFGGTALVQPLASVTLPLPAGGAQVPFAIPASGSFLGVAVDAQGVLLDAGASHGIAFSAGLELVLGT